VSAPSIAVRLKQLAFEMGWLDGLLYLLDRVLGIVSGRRARIQKNYLVAQPVFTGRRLPSNRGTSIEIRRVAPLDPIIGEFPRPARAAPYRFNQNAICLAALHAGRFIGFIWFTIGPYQEDEFRCRFVPLPDGQSAWDFDLYVDPAHRNGIAFLKLWDEANALLASRRVRWTLSRISAFNRGSMISHTKMGARRVGVVTTLSIGSWQIAASTVPPYLHFSTGPDSFPTLLLDTDLLCGTEPAR
jgi:hypothetical protein